MDQEAGLGMRHVNIKINKAADERNVDDGLALNYRINEVPPWYLCIFLGFQHYLTMLTSTLSISLLVGSAVCMGDDHVAKSELLGTLFFVSGIVTLLQSTVGSRLPIVQGGSFAFLAPTLAILKLEKWKCPEPGSGFNGTSLEKIAFNVTSAENHLMGDTEIWQIRIREIQGAIIAASVCQVLIGLSGVVGFLTRFIGPLVIAPTITLVGLSLFSAGGRYSSGQWGIAVLTMALVALFSQYLRNVNIPCFQIACKKGDHSIRKTKLRFFQLFPVILAICLSWLLCFVLTITNVWPSDPGAPGYKARTDIKLATLSNAKWFRFPYPLQWGIPTFSAGAVLGMIGGVLAGIIESIGDYYACARISGAPPPPNHAVNRGILIEGIGCVLAGLWGTGNGTTSYTQNTGTIGITKVGSRRVIQYTGLILLVCGMLGKVGAFFVIIPDPVIGGLFIVLFGMVAAVGVSNLQFVDMNSSRNLFIYGTSVLFGMALPDWMSSNPDAIKSGSDVFDQIVTILFNSHMFIGGVTAFVLDNTIPGSAKERGIIEWKSQGELGNVQGHHKDDTTYDFPCGMSYINGCSCLRFLPLCPTFLKKHRGDRPVVTKL